MRGVFYNVICFPALSIIAGDRTPTRISAWSHLPPFVHSNQRTGGHLIGRRPAGRRCLLHLREGLGADVTISFVVMGCGLLYSSIGFEAVVLDEKRKTKYPRCNICNIASEYMSCFVRLKQYTLSWIEEYQKGSARWLLPAFLALV